MKKDKDPNKPDVEKDDPHRQIVPRVSGLGAEIFEWLESLFELSESDAAPGTPKPGTDTFPDSVVLKMAGRSGSDQGGDITRFDWKATAASLPTREKLVEIANDIVRAAQKDANALGRSQRYGLFAYSNRKGAGNYARHLFNVEASIKGDLASDDEDTHRDRLLSTSLAHARWQQEQFAEAISGVMNLQRDIIRQQQSTIAQMEADRRQWILTYEESLSKKQERETAAEYAKLKTDAIREGFDLLKGLLPTVQAYLTKGKLGLVDGVKKFLDSLTGEQKLKLFGADAEADAILDVEQRQILLQVADGATEPKRLAEFMQMLRPEQIEQAQAILTEGQAQQLYSLGAAAHAAAQPSH
jgi:hypothetical protein